MTILDTELKSKFLTVICDTIVNSKNRNDFVVLMDELATECTIYTQNNLLSNKTFSSSSVDSKPVSTHSKMEIVATTTDPTMSVVKPIKAKPAIPKTAPADIQHREKVNLAEKLADTHFADVSNMVDDVSTDDRVADAGKTIDPEQTTPVWMSENINLEEYWVYDYSTPCTTLHGNCGCPCVQTELWLVHRRKYKLSLVDAEFATLHALHDFLDPRKELAAENNIYPLEKIDAELADNEKEQHAKLHADKTQSKFNRFIEFYHQFNGDPAQIATAMGIQKQSVYAYKNKAKTMGVLK